MTRDVSARRLALLAFALSFVVLVLNGRSIGSGDTNAVENTSAALASRGTPVLPPSETPDPFTREVEGGRLSIYPVLPALIAAPLFLVFSLFFDLTPSAIQVAGKLSAALMSAIATGLLALSFAKRASPTVALLAALAFGLGTSVFSTAQALWQHPAALLFLVVALGALEQMEAAGPDRRRSPALVAALALSLAAASRPAAIPMCAVLLVFLLTRARPHAVRLLLVAAIPAILVGLYNLEFFGAPWRFGPTLGGRFGAAFPESVAGLLVSPARGLLIFTPVAALALWGLVAAARRVALARGLLAGVAVHFIFVSLWNEWHGGESFGPRLLTEALPALFFYLPEAVAAWPKLGLVFGAMSLVAQLVGGWTYDYRWERLHQRGQDFNAALWSWRESPLVFAVREGVVVQGLVDIDGRRIRLRPHRSVPFGPKGSMIEATPSGVRVSGTRVVRDIRLERGTRITEGWITLTHPGDAVAFRSEVEGARTLRLTGSLQGALRVETVSKVTTTPLDGDFDFTLSVALGSQEDVFIRAERGELRLGRIEVR